MKGDYSQPRLMPAYCSEENDLPSAYLVYAVGSVSGQAQRSPGGGPLSYGLISAAFSRDLAEIMVLIDINGPVNKICEQLPAFLRLFGEAKMKLEIHP
jgi:hypothetical protein